MHHGQVAGHVKEFLESEEGAAIASGNVDMLMHAIVHELKNQVEKASFIQAIHSESAKMRAVNETLHGLIPIVMDELQESIETEMRDELHIDVLIASVYEGSGEHVPYQPGSAIPPQPEAPHSIM